MNKKKRSTIYGPFVPIMKDMISSPAFMKLTNASRTAYLLLKAQCRHFEQTEVKFPYSHAQKYMGRDTFSAAIKQLTKMGFIEKSFAGGLYRRTNIYRLVDSWRAFKDQKQKHNRMAYSIRGMEIPTTKTEVKPLNKCGNPNYMKKINASDGMEILTTHGMEIPTCHGEP